MWGGTFPIIGFHCKTPPQGIHYSYTGGGYYDLEWNSNDGGTYEVAVGLYGDNPDTVSRRYVTTDTTMRLDSLVPGTIYAVWVRGQCHYSTASYDTVIWSAWSGKIPVVATATGVQEAAGPSFELNPNPASRTVNVSCEATEGTIEVVDMDGRLWLQVPATQHTLDISHMGWGYYVVRLTTPEGTAIRLLQVN